MLFVSAVMLVVSCAKKSQKAVVIAKDHTPAHVEGTEYQERQTDREQWLVKVEMENGRKAEAPVDKPQWDSLKSAIPSTPATRKANTPTLSGPSTFASRRCDLALR